MEDIYTIDAYNTIAKWDGSRLEKIDSGFPDQSLHPIGITDLEVFRGELYMSVIEVLLEDGMKYVLAKWNGESWEGVKGFESGESVSSPISGLTALENFGHYLVATTVGKTFFYNGESVKEMEQRLNGSIKTFEVLNNQLYAGGSFNGGDSPNRIAKLGGLYNLNETETQWQIFPNPATAGRLLLNYTLNDNSKVIVKFFDLSGKLLLTKTFNDLKGDYLRGFNLSTFAKGNYLINITSKEFEETKIIVVE